MIEQTALTLLGTILTVAIGTVSTFASNYFKESTNAKKAKTLAHIAAATEAQINAKKGLAYDAVLFAEDAWGAVGGNKKLEEAVKWAVHEADSRGITDITSDGIEGLIRTKFQELKTKLKTDIPAVETTTPVTTPADKTEQVVTPAATTPTAQTDSASTISAAATPASTDAIAAAATAAHDAISTLQAAAAAATTTTTDLTPTTATPAATA